MYTKFDDNTQLLYFSLQRLREFKVNVREFTDANDDANKFKNRIANALPCEFSVMMECLHQQKHCYNNTINLI